MDRFRLAYVTNGKITGFRVHHFDVGDFLDALKKAKELTRPEQEILVFDMITCSLYVNDGWVATETTLKYRVDVNKRFDH
mgnify:CR=1 FL=1